MNTTPTQVPDGYDNTLQRARIERVRDAAAELLDAVRQLGGGTGVVVVDATDYLVEQARAQGLPDYPVVGGLADVDHFAGAA